MGIGRMNMARRELLGTVTCPKTRYGEFIFNTLLVQLNYMEITALSVKEETTHSVEEVLRCLHSPTLRVSPSSQP